jgi:AcrR family transcriptional regulator
MPSDPIPDTGRDQRSRPLRADARRNRSRVLDAARGAFASDGLAVPLDEIARRAGVGPGTVYRHYPTKDALFAAVILDVLESVRDQANALAKSPDAGEAFFTFFAQLIETGATNKAIFDALSGASPEVQTASRAVSAELGSALAELLARAQRANTVRGDVTPDDLNALVLGALAAQTAVAPGGSPQRLIQVTCDGLRPPA